MLPTNRVPDKQRRAGQEAPRWLIVVVAIVGVTVLTYFGYQALTGREGEPGPRKKVYPGMYDLRAEVAKMQAAQQSGKSNGR